MVILEVIISLAFLYFLLSIIISGINEAISTLFNRKGLELKRAIKLLLNGENSDWGNLFYQHPQIMQIKEKPKWQSIRAWPARVWRYIIGNKNPVRFNPSYITSGTFADVFLDFLSRDTKDVLDQKVSSHLHPDESAFIGKMRRFVEASDAYNYRQLENLYLNANHPAHQIIKAVKDAIGLINKDDFQIYKSCVTDAIDKYSRSFHHKADNNVMYDQISNRLIQLQSNPNFGIIENLVSRSVDFGSLKTNIENWFNDYMERVSGWYKRRMHFTVFLISAVLAIMWNVDSVEITRHLFTDSHFRESIVAAAEQYQSSQIDEDDPTKDLETRIREIQENMNQFNTLLIPIKKYPAGAQGINWPLKIVGILLTVFAVSLGAPFWYDIMVKTLKLRSTGKEPKE
jgi:hypothetical protein